MGRIVEEWRPVVGYEGLYEVSDWGRVKNRFGKLLAQSEINEHLRVHLWKNGKGKHFFVHRLVAEAFMPNLENKPIVGHTKPLPNGKEDSKANEVWNIAWMTYQENRMYGTCNERISQSQKRREFTDEHRKNLSEGLKNSEKFHEVVASDAYRQKLKDAQKNHPQRNREDLSEPIDLIVIETGEVLSSFPSAKQAARDLGLAQSNISRACNGGFYYKGKWINVYQAYNYIWKKRLN